MVNIVNKLFRFECYICPTDRNCRQCKRYKDKIKCPTERRWYYGNYTPLNRLIDSILLLIFIIPVFFIFIIVWIADNIFNFDYGEI